MWFIAQVWVIACGFACGFILFRITGDPQISGIFGVVLGLVVGGGSIIMLGDLLDWVCKRLTR